VKAQVITEPRTPTFVLHALFVYAPFMHPILASPALASGDVLASAVILLVVGLEKWWRRRGTVKQGIEIDCCSECRAAGGAS